MISILWGAVQAALRAGFQAWFALREARDRGRAEEIARRNDEIAKAERRAGEVRDRTREDVANDLDQGKF